MIKVSLLIMINIPIFLAYAGQEAIVNMEPKADTKIETHASSDFAASETPKQDGPLIPDDFAKLRDPFRAPESQIISLESKSELESYGIEDYKMNAAITGPSRIRAMISAPDGKTFFVSEKMKIGLRNGIIKKILPEKIIVKEKIINAIGQQEFIDSEIRMEPLSKILAASKAKRTQNTVSQNSNGPNYSGTGNGLPANPYPSFQGPGIPQLPSNGPPSVTMGDSSPPNGQGTDPNVGGQKDQSLEWLKSGDSPSQQNSTEGNK